MYADDQGWVLCVCGQGSTLACIATSAALAHCPADSGRLLVANFGLAGAEPGRWKLGQALLVNRVTDELSGRSSYPERGVRTDWAEAPLRTVAKPVWGRAASKGDPAPPPLYDMEAYGFICAAERFVTNSQIALGKVVSDFVDAETPPRWEDITERLEANYRRGALEFIRILQAQSSFLHGESRSLALETVTPWVELLHRSVAVKLQLTVHQSRELYTALKAFALFHSAEKRIETGERLLMQIAEYEGKSKSERGVAHRRLLHLLHTL